MRLSPSLTERITRRRALGGRTADGGYVEGPPVETTIRGAVIPIGEERLIEQGGLRGETRFTVYTREHLQALAEDSRGDELEIRGAWFRVVNVKRHSTQRTDFYEAEVVSPC